MLEPDETMVGGEIAYRLDWSERSSGYLSVSRGYKAGGFNLGLVPAGRREFGEEILWNVEVGAKSLFVDDRLALRRHEVHRASVARPADCAIVETCSSNRSKQSRCRLSFTGKVITGPFCTAKNATSSS